LKADGFFYLMNDNYVFDLDGTYPVTDEKFKDVAQKLRQLIRDDKLKSLSL
jgi:DNA primase